MDRKLALVYFTEAAKTLAEKISFLLSDTFSCYMYDKNKTLLNNFVCECFTSHWDIAFISAAGIAVRTIAPFLTAKDTDPAVVVLDEKGQFVIPILSGHVGGGNELAILLANHLSAVPIITTATDLNQKFAVDNWCKKLNFAIADTSKIKLISSAILRGERVFISSDFPLDGVIPDGLTESINGETGICISLDDTKIPFNNTLNAIPKIISIGVGCRKHTDSEKFENFILKLLKEHHISIKSTMRLASIDLKSNEKCILDFSKKYSVEFKTFSAQELSTLKGDFSSSAFVQKTTGVDNVCERSALYLLDNASLIIKKTVQDGITVAVSCLKKQKEWS